MTEYSKVAIGTYVSTGNPKTVNLPFLPTFVQINNITACIAQRAGAYALAYAQTSLTSIDAYVALIGSSSTGSLAPQHVSAGGLSIFSTSSNTIFGPRQQIVSATAANPISFTVTAHGYSTGDIVLFEGLYQTSTTGMPQLCGMPFVITVTGANTFALSWNGSQSNYTALSASPVGAYVKKVLYPSIYCPKVGFINAISASGNNTVIGLTNKPNFVVGSRVSFRIPPQWGTQQLNTNQAIPGFPFYATVIAQSQNLTGSNVTIDVPFSSLTPFNTNIPVAKIPGLCFPQIIPVGDVNTGGGQPVVNSFPTVNGPAIDGSFINNTSMGFIVGASICGNSGDTISWEAYATDYSSFI